MSKTSVAWPTLGFLLIISLASSCNQSTQVTSIVTSSPPSTPKKSGSIQSPIQTPSSELPGWNATPAPGKSNLRGRIVITRSSIVLGELYLARAVQTDREGVALLELDEKNSPRASIDRNTGEFVFLNVTPGTYGLIVWEPQNSFPVADPDTRETLFVELPADEVVDVGSLEVP